MSIKLLHVADVHLDARYGWLGENAPRARQALRSIFRRIVDLAIEREAAALLIAGDLFDSNSPSEESLGLVGAQLSRLAVPTFILPGNHDPLAPGSVYDRPPFSPSLSSALTNNDDGRLFVFRPNITKITLGGLSLSVHARATEARTSSLSPLAGLSPDSGSTYNVALAHGSYSTSTQISHDFPISPRSIEESGMGYVALGHWHSFRDCSAPRTKAFYSGTPELISADEPGRALLVELDTLGNSSVEPIALSSYSLASVEEDVTGKSAEELIDSLRPLYSKDRVLALTLRGMRDSGSTGSAFDLEEALRGQFLGVRVRDESAFGLSAAERQALSPESVAGAFARRLETKIENAESDQERRIAERALQLGLALLARRNVL